MIHSLPENKAIRPLCVNHIAISTITYRLLLQTIITLFSSTFGTVKSQTINNP